MCIDGAFISLEVDAEYVVQQLSSRIDMSPVAGEELDNGELSRSESQRFVAVGDLVA